MIFLMNKGGTVWKVYMGNRSKSATWFVLAVAVLMSGPISASDWSQCGFDFDAVSSKARDQAFAAQQMAMMESEIEMKEIRVDSARAELESCRANPEIYDYYDDGCQTQYYEYQSAVDDYNYSVDAYNSALQLYKMQLSSLRSALEALEYSCGIVF